MTAPRMQNRSEDALDWLDHPSGDADSPHLILVDDFVRDGHYIVRADLPGLDADHDIDIQIADDLLTLVAHRREEQIPRRHCEVAYGELSRTLRLPTGCRVSDLSTRYDAGVLEVSIPLGEVGPL